MKLNIITLAVVVIGLTIFALHANQWKGTPAHLAGAAIFIPSFILFVIARVQLGKAFSVQAKATELVTTGIYSRIRNPIYVFGSLMFVGVIVWVARPIFFLVLLFLIPLQVIRARNEERVLHEKFGDAYLEYKSKTWF